MKILPQGYVIYRLDPEVEVVGPLEVAGLASKPFELADLALFFRDDPCRQATFRTFLDQGFQGMLVHDGPCWAGYGWLTSAQGPCAPHLSGEIGRERAPWLFYAHTREGYRGLGIQKALIRQRLGLVAGSGRRPGWVYSDTARGNLASRRALLAVGFRPAGTLIRMELPVSFLGFQPLCWWNRDGAHPSLPETSRKARP